MLSWPKIATFVALMPVVASIKAQDSSEQVPEPAPVRQVIYESPIPVPTFVPAETLLSEGNANNPRTEEGWIIMHRPLREPIEVEDVWSVSPKVFRYLDELRRYDTQIRLANAQIESLKRRLAHYHYYNETNALFVTVENISLSLLEAQERLNLLRFERTAFLRNCRLGREVTDPADPESPVIPGVYRGF